MSLQVMQWAWQRPINNSAHKLALLALADRADDNGECWSGVEWLIEKCSIPRRTVLRALKELEDQGFITVKRRSGDGTGRKTNVYQLQIENSAAGQSAKSAQGANLAYSGQCAKSGEGKVPNRYQNRGAMCQIVHENGGQCAKAWHLIHHLKMIHH